MHERPHAKPEPDAEAPDACDTGMPPLFVYATKFSHHLAATSETLSGEIFWLMDFGAYPRTSKRAPLSLPSPLPKQRLAALNGPGNRIQYTAALLPPNHTEFLRTGHGSFISQRTAGIKALTARSRKEFLPECQRPKFAAHKSRKSS